MSKGVHAFPLRFVSAPPKNLTLKIVDLLNLLSQNFVDLTKFWPQNIGPPNKCWTPRKKFELFFKFSPLLKYIKNTLTLKKSNKFYQEQNWLITGAEL